MTQPSLFPEPVLNWREFYPGSNKWWVGIVVGAEQISFIAYGKTWQNAMMQVMERIIHDGR